MRSSVGDQRLVRADRIRILAIVSASCLLLAPSASATSWTPPVNVHPQTYADDQFARLATPGGGAPWVIWLGADSTEGDAEIYYSRWNGDGWDPAALVNPPNQYSELSPRESEAADGGLWVAWKAPNPGTNNLYLGLASHWSGNAWSVPDTIWRNGGRYDVPAVAAVSQTEAWIVRDGYPSQGGDSDIYAYHIKDGQLDSEFQFVRPDSDEIVPSITMSAEGVPWLVWYRLNWAFPPQSLMWSSHLDQGSWTPPEQIPAPAGALAPKIVPDAAGRIWVITMATDPSDPGVGQDSEAAWAIPNSGFGWGTPIRLNPPLVSPDSAQGHLSVSGGPGTNPRAIWIRFSVFSVTRRDLMTSAWNGASWTTPELIGDIADSIRVSWPDVAEYEGRIWAAYNRYLKAPPYNENVFALHSVGAPIAAEEANLEVHSEADGVLVRWSSRTRSQSAGMRLYRNAAIGRAGVTPPGDATRIHEGGPSDAESGAFLDSDVVSGEYEYWLEILKSPTGSVFIGPRRVRYGPSPRVPSIISAIPNPSSGSVVISGQGGAALAGLEVFDVHGRRVRSLAISNLGVGAFEVRWDGLSDADYPVSSGVYFLRARSRDGRSSDPHRVLLIR